MHNNFTISSIIISWLSTLEFFFEIERNYHWKLILIDFEQHTSLLGNNCLRDKYWIFNIRKPWHFSENHECLINTKEWNQEIIGVHLHWKWDFQLYQQGNSLMQSSEYREEFYKYNWYSSNNSREKRDNLPHYENNCENTQICLTSRTVWDTIRHSGRYW